MIGRALAFEWAGLRRSWAVPITVLFAVGGGALGRTVTWLAEVLQASEIDALSWGPMAGVEIAVPLVLLSWVIAAAFLFGRDLSVGTMDIVLTAPIRRDAVVWARLVVLLGWVAGLAALAVVADVSMRASLGLSSFDPGPSLTVAGTTGATLAGYATLPLVGWIALRFRGVIASVGAGIAVHTLALLLHSLVPTALLPWNAPLDLVAGEGSAAIVIGPVLLLAGGVAACLWQIRRLDLV